jgi:hypothetical protein
MTVAPTFFSVCMTNESHTYFLFLIPRKRYVNVMWKEDRVKTAT